MAPGCARLRTIGLPSRHGNTGHLPWRPHCLGGRDIQQPCGVPLEPGTGPDDDGTIHRHLLPYPETEKGAPECSSRHHIAWSAPDRRQAGRCGSATARNGGRICSVTTAPARFASVRLLADSASASKSPGRRIATTSRHSRRYSAGEPAAPDDGHRPFPANRAGHCMRVRPVRSRMLLRPSFVWIESEEPVDTQSRKRLVECGEHGGARS
jgi:hypothetical protein